MFIANTGTDPVPTKDVGTAVTQRVQFEFQGFTFNSQSPYQVPEGKQLVIEFVTFHDLNRSALVDRLTVSTSHAGVNATHWLATDQQGTNGDVTTLQTKIIAEPGTRPFWGLRLNQPLGSSTATHFLHLTWVGTLYDV
ncbi:MAG: hypothetical protein ACRDT6_24220 [Micromonosporaceae bacterium]